MTVAIDNERTKLAAHALDRASTACLAVGIFSPLATLLQSYAHPPLVGVAVSFAGWLGARQSCYILQQGECLEA
jgi:hypothetical protein